MLRRSQDPSWTEVIPTRAIVLASHGGPEVLRISEAPDPVPGPSDVLVVVRAAGVNRADLAQREGHYPPPGPPVRHEIPGLEFAGTVRSVGSQVQRHRVGDRVFGLLPGGGYAEAVATHERLAMPTPAGLSDEEAAALPEAFLTAFDALFSQAGLRPGESLLVHAIGSGVGTAALQLGRWAGATVYGTARSPKKCRQAMAMGAALAVPTGEGAGDFVAALEAARGGRGIDVILDLVGGSYLAANLAALGPLGRMVTLATVGGRRAEVDLGLVMAKRLHLTGSGLRGRGVEEKIALTQAFERQALPAVAPGGADGATTGLHAVLDRVLPWTEAAQAHRILDAGQAFGKMVLRVDG